MVGAVLAVAGFGATAGASDKHRRSSCPAHDRRPVHSSVRGADKTLVPGAPLTVLLCRYSRAGPERSDPQHLVAHRLVSRAETVERLTRQFDALKRPQGAMSCPADRGEAILAFFRYGDTGKSEDQVSVGLGGCQTVTNGGVTATAIFAPGPKLVHRLELLLSR